jgi:hypothetical protein
VGANAAGATDELHPDVAGRVSDEDISPVLGRVPARAAATGELTRITKERAAL